MKFRNTSLYPTPVVRVYANFALQQIEARAYVSELVVTNTTNTSAFRGRCTGSRCIVRLGPPDVFAAPIYQHYRKRAPRYHVNDWVEALVSIVAHEATHARHFKHKQGVNEVQCEVSALWALEALRKVRGTIDAEASQALVRQLELDSQKEEREIIAKSVGAKISALQRKIQIWTRKEKTAITYLKKYRTKLRRLERPKAEVSEALVVGVETEREAACSSAKSGQ